MIACRKRLRKPQDMEVRKSSANVTIYDVARESGVSYATVSRALNGHADVSVQTREHVVEVSERLNYHPRAIARGLTKNKSWLMGVAYRGEFDNPFFGKLLSRAKEIIEPAGYELLFFHDALGVESSELVTRARYRQVDGLLVAGVTQQSPAVQALQDLDIPLVSINFRISSRSSSVISHHFRGSIEAMSHLWSLGHRKIGIVAGDLDITSGLFRYEAYIRFLKLHGLEVRSDWIARTSFSHEPEESSYRLVDDVMRSSDRPTAWFCSEDMMAIGAMRACLDLGYSVPEDVSIVGFDDIDAARFVQPQLTTVRQDRELIGQLSARELLRLVGNHEQSGTAITVPTRLIVRASTGPAP